MSKIILYKPRSVDTVVVVQTAPTVVGDPNICSQKVPEFVHPDIRCNQGGMTDV